MGSFRRNDQSRAACCHYLTLFADPDSSRSPSPPRHFHGGAGRPLPSPRGRHRPLPSAARQAAPAELCRAATGAAAATPARRPSPPPDRYAAQGRTQPAEPGGAHLPLPQAPVRATAKGAELDV